MKKYVLALDEGTTSARAILFDANANVVSMAQHELRPIYPFPGWVEQDAMEIYANQYAAMTECIAKSGISPDEIAAIGITNQRETTVVWEKETGKPVANAIVWQCRRTAGICEELEKQGLTDYIKENTGLRPDAYFSATKIKWLLDKYDKNRKRAKSGELLFGTVDTWLLWKLTDGKAHITDRTNASRTMLYNIKKDCWDEKMPEALCIPMEMLPEIRSSSEVYASIDLMGAKIPVAGIAGDQQAALFGQRCFGTGQAKVTYGTGCFLLMNTGQKPVRSQNGLLTTVAATEKGKPLQYALEGSVFTGGAVIKWLRDNLRLINESRDSEYFAKKVSDSGGVYFVPAFSGLGAPYWDMNARGILTGLTAGAGREHIIRAALESIAYQTADLLFAMTADSSQTLESLKVDGGASANNFLMQFQADISDITVLRPKTQEATALGAAFLAGLGVGFFESREELTKLTAECSEFISSMGSEEREKLVSGWHSAVKSAMGGE